MSFMDPISSLKTVEWKNDKVVMIDQTKLPNELVFVEFDNFNQLMARYREGLTNRKKKKKKSKKSDSEE